MKEDEIINKLCFTVGRLLAQQGKEAGFTVWPSPMFSPVEGELYAAPYLMPLLYEDILELRKKGYTIEEIARLFKAPSRIAQLVWPLHTLKLIGMPRKDRIDLVLKIIELISVYREEPFCENGRNLIWSQRRINEITGESQWIRLVEVTDARQFRRTLSTLNGMLWLLCELLYFDFHGAGHEFHGPYYLNDNQMLIVREFYDLKPDIWPFMAQLEFARITTYSIYSKNEVVYDFFNRTRSPLQLSDHLVHFIIDVDGRVVNELSQIESCLYATRDALERGSDYIGKLSRKELLEKFAEAYFFIIKPLQEELGKNWRPPNRLYADIQHEKRKATVNNALAGFAKTLTLPTEKFVNEIALLFDPR